LTEDEGTNKEHSEAYRRNQEEEDQETRKAGKMK